MNKHTTLIGIIKLMRPQSVILMLLFVYIPIVIRTSNYLYGIQQLLPFYFLLTGEIILNDYIDVEKDKINKGHRPLAAQIVSISCAKKLISLFLFVALLVGIIAYLAFPIRLLLFIGVFALLTIYSIFIKQIAIIKTLLTALATALCLCFIFTYGSFSYKMLLLLFVAFFYIWSRELLMDIRDYEGDRQYNCNTIAVRFGKKNTYLVAILLMLISQLLYGYWILLYGQLLLQMLYLLGISIICICIILFQTDNIKLQNTLALLLWIPILLTIPSLLL